MGKYIRKDTPFTTAHVKDIRGQRFGKLVVKEFDHSEEILLGKGDKRICQEI